jgi:hypothetical protein
MVCATASELTTAGLMGSVTDLFDSHVKWFGASTVSVSSPSPFLYPLSPQGGKQLPDNERL